MTNTLQGSPPLPPVEAIIFSPKQPGHAQKNADGLYTNQQEFGNKQYAVVDRRQQTNKFCGHKSVNWKPCPVRYGKGSREFPDTQSSEWGALATRADERGQTKRWASCEARARARKLTRVGCGST